MIDSVYLAQLAVYLFAAVAVPTALARWNIGAGWPQIGCALATWGLILLPMLAGTGQDDDGRLAVGALSLLYGWAIVPTIAMIYELTNTPGWIIAQWRRWSHARAQ